MAVTLHHLASESALSVLRHGGDAIQAMVAAAATIAVAYPHMNGIGGDGFWLIVPPEGEPLAIDASAAGQRRLRRFMPDMPIFLIAARLPPSPYPARSAAGMKR